MFLAICLQPTVVASGKFTQTEQKMLGNISSVGDVLINHLLLSYPYGVWNDACKKLARE